MSVVCPNCEATIVPPDKQKKKKKQEVIHTGLCYRCQHKIDEQDWKEKNRDQKM